MHSTNPMTESILDLIRHRMNDPIPTSTNLTDMKSAGLWIRAAIIGLASNATLHPTQSSVRAPSMALRAIRNARAAPNLRSRLIGRLTGSHGEWATQIQ